MRAFLIYLPYRDRHFLPGCVQPRGTIERLEYQRANGPAHHFRRNRYPLHRVGRRPGPDTRGATGKGDCRKLAYAIAPDFRSSSRRDNRRIVERCNGCRNTEDGRKDKQDGMSFDRNRRKRLEPHSFMCSLSQLDSHSSNRIARTSSRQQVGSHNFAEDGPENFRI